jgi:acetyl esterase/lipase
VGGVAAPVIARHSGRQRAVPARWRTLEVRPTYALGLVFAPLALLTAQAVPAAVITDPAPDRTSPATMMVAAIPSPVADPSPGANQGAGSAVMNGVLYVAAGKGPHPTLLLLHGLPGNEQNLDLAQAVRRAGWNVLTLHYRGAWGSGGAFSFGHALEDVHAALAWLRDPRHAEPGRVDVARIAVAGHSMGGWLAALAGAADQRVLGVAMISAWNLGAFAKACKADGARGRASFEQDMAQNRESLAGCTPQGLAEDAFAHADEWDFRGCAARLAARPLLLVSSQDGNGPESRALAEAVAAAGGKAVQQVAMATDHAYSDHRIALQSALVRWLEERGERAK